MWLCIIIYICFLLLLWQLTTNLTQTYYLIVLEIRSPESQWAKIKVSAGLCSFWRLWGETVFGLFQPLEATFVPWLLSSIHPAITSLQPLLSLSYSLTLLLPISFVKTFEIPSTLSLIIQHSFPFSKILNICKIPLGMQVCIFTGPGGYDVDIFG